jgi:hypothetical protein
VRLLGVDDGWGMVLLAAELDNVLDVPIHHDGSSNGLPSLMNPLTFEEDE